MFRKNGTAKKKLLQRIGTSRARSGSNAVSKISASSYSTSKIEYEPTHLRRKNLLPAPQVVGSKGKIHQKQSNSVTCGWKFSAVTLTNNELRLAAGSMLEIAFKRMHFSDKPKKIQSLMSIARPAIRQFVDRVEEKYTSSVFHSFIHAIDVSQLMFTLIDKFFKLKIKNDELFYLIVACLCHDICHPGASGNTLIKQGLINENQSLEDYHIAKTIELIDDNSIDLFNNVDLLSEKRRLKLKKYCKLLIAATDIDKHKQFVEASLKTKEKNGFLQIEHLSILMKVSDLANIAREFKDSCSWSEYYKIESEAERKFNETANENIILNKNLNRDGQFQELGIKLCLIQETVIDDLKATNELRLGTSKSTLGFMKLFAFPLVNCLNQLSSKAGVAYGKRIRDNQVHWNNLKL